MKKKGLFTAIAFTTATLLTSQVQAATIPTLNIPAEKITMDPGMYYSLDNGKKWNKRTTNDFAVAAIIATKPRHVWLDSDINHAAGVTDITLPIRLKAPTKSVITTNYLNEGIKFGAGLQYKVFGDSDWSAKTTADATELDLSGWDAGGKVLYRFAATSDNFASKESTFTVPARPAAPSLKLNADSNLTVSATTFEYKTTRDTVWQSVTDADKTAKRVLLEDVVPDAGVGSVKTIVEVRAKAKTTAFPSLIQKVNLYPRAATPVPTTVDTVSAGKVIFDGATILEYKVDKLKDGTNITTATTADIATAGTWKKAVVKDGKTTIVLDAIASTSPTALYVRTPLIPEKLDSKKQVVTPGVSSSRTYDLKLGARPAGPSDSDVRVNYATNTFGFTSADAAKYEWSNDGANTWNNFTNNKVIPLSMYGKTVSIRIKAVIEASGGSLPSVVKNVAVSNYKLAPAITLAAGFWIDGKILGVNDLTTVEFTTNSSIDTWTPYTATALAATLTNPEISPFYQFRIKGTESVPASFTKAIQIVYPYNNAWADGKLVGLSGSTMDFRLLTTTDTVALAWVDYSDAKFNELKVRATDGGYPTFEIRLKGTNIVKQITVAR